MNYVHYLGGFFVGLSLDAWVPPPNPNIIRWPLTCIAVALMVGIWVHEWRKP